MTRTLTCLLVFAVATPLFAADGDWPQFRGPNADSVVERDGLPVEWDADTNVKWKVELPGRGWSSPIVWGEKVFLTTAVIDQESGQPQAGGQRQLGGRGRGGPPDDVYRYEVHCLDLNTGQEIWKQVAQKAKPRIPTHRSNTYASETPVTDGERVYAYFGMTGLFCYDLDGNLVWKKDLGVFPMQGDWGTSSSPVLFGDLLFVLVDNEEQSFLAALDKKTGEQRWKVDRDEGSSWATPIVWENAERTELVTVGSKVRSYDPKTGELLWELTVGGRASSSPTGTEDMLYIGTEDRSGRGRRGGGGGSEESANAGGGLFAVKAGASGDVTPKEGQSSSEAVAWSHPKMGPPMSSPLIYKGYVYALDRQGMISCYESKTGKPAYEKERLSGGRAFWASPWAYDGKVFCLDDNGTTYVLAAGGELNEVGRNQLGEQTWASCAIAGGRLIIRGVDHVYCIAR